MTLGWTQPASGSDSHARVRTQASRTCPEMIPALYRMGITLEKTARQFNAGLAHLAISQYSGAHE